MNQDRIIVRSHAHEAHPLVVERAAFAQIRRARAQQDVRASAVLEMAALGNNRYIPALARVMT